MRSQVVNRRRKACFVLLRPDISVKKIYWDFHKGDNDYNPTMPHGHSLNGRSLDGRYKLELWSGIIYKESTGEVYGIAKAKDMERLYMLNGFREFVEECRREYMQRYPAINLPPLTPNEGFHQSCYMNYYRKSSRKNRLKRVIFATECE